MKKTNSHTSRHFFKSIYLVLPISFCLLINPAGYSASQTDWNKLENSPFQIFYSNQDKFYVDELSNLLGSSEDDLSKKIGLKIADPVKVFLCSSDRIFAELTGNFIPHWGAGVADPVRSVIVLKSPSVTGDHENFPKLVRHELVHILIGQSVRFPEALPRWFSEGIAILFSNDEQFATGKAISKALISDSIVPLDEIDDVLKFQQAKARLAYEESYSFTQFLEEKFGFDGLVKLIGVLNRSHSFDKTFSEVFEADLFELELEWYQSLESKYRWRFLQDFEIFLWISILFLFIFVFVVIRLRNRRIMNKWEKDERLANSNL